MFIIKADIEKAIHYMKRRKASGPDIIPAEAIKTDIDTSTEILHGLFVKIMQYLCARRSTNVMERRVPLLSVPGKVLNRVILDRLKTGVNAKFRDQQAGFRENRSCTNQIATLRIIVDQSMEWDSSLYINVVDYEKAFDSIDTDLL